MVNQQVEYGEQSHSQVGGFEGDFSWQVTVSTRQILGNEWSFGMQAPTGTWLGHR